MDGRGIALAVAGVPASRPGLMDATADIHEDLLLAPWSRAATLWNRSGGPPGCLVQQHAHALTLCWLYAQARARQLLAAGPSMAAANNVDNAKQTNPHFDRGHASECDSQSRNELASTDARAPFTSFEQPSCSLAVGSQYGTANTAFEDRGCCSNDGSGAKRVYTAALSRTADHDAGTNPVGKSIGAVIAAGAARVEAEGAAAASAGGRAAAACAAAAGADARAIAEQMETVARLLDTGLVIIGEGGFRHRLVGFVQRDVCERLRAGAVVAMLQAFRRGGQTALAVVPELDARLHESGDPAVHIVLRRVLADVKAAAMSSAARALAAQGLPPRPLHHCGTLLVRLLAPADAESHAPCCWPLPPSQPYWQPHVDKHNAASYDVSAVLYLSDHGSDFKGGVFCFHDDDGDVCVRPRVGELLLFSSTGENLHSVARVESGARFALLAWFTYDADHSTDRLHACDAVASSSGHGEAVPAAVSAAVPDVSLGVFAGDALAAACMHPHQRDHEASKDFLDRVTSNDEAGLMTLPQRDGFSPGQLLRSWPEPALLSAALCTLSSNDPVRSSLVSAHRACLPLARALERMYRDEIGDGEIPACSVNLESELPASWSWRLGPHQPLSRDREFTGTPDAKVQVRQAFAMYAGEAGAAAMIEGANGVEPILGLRGLCEALRSRVDVYARLAHLKSESALRPNPLSCIKLDATMSKETVRTDNKDSKVDGFEVFD